MENFAIIGICITIVVFCISTVLIVYRLTSKRGTFKGSWGNKSIEVGSEPVAAGEPTTEAVIRPPIIKTSEATKDSETRPPDDEKPSADRQGLIDLVTAKDITELERAWTALDLSVEGPDAREVWTSYYLNQRLVRGAPGARDALLTAHNDNPSWVFPAIHLARSAADIADWDGAENYMIEALRRSHGNHRNTVLSNFVSLEYKSKGLDAAIQKARALASDKLDIASASTIDGILFHEDEEKLKDTLTIQIMRELRQRNEISLSQKFSLAYQYAKENETLDIGFRHYVALDEAGHSKGVVNNNIGVLYGEFGEPFLQIQSYEIALENGSVLAGINLAQALIQAGFTTRAEKLIDSLGEDDESQANRSSAIAAIKTARDNLETNRAKIREKTLRTYEEYQKAITSILKFWKSSSEISDGLFVGGNSYFDSIGYNLTTTMSGRKWSGTLIRHGLFYEGNIREEGSGLLSTNHARALVAPTAPDNMIVLLFMTTTPPILVHHLERKSKSDAG